MYRYMCIYMHIYICIYVYICIDTCTYMFIYVCIHVHICLGFEKCVCHVAPYRPQGNPNEHNNFDVSPVFW